MNTYEEWFKSLSGEEQKAIWYEGQCVGTKLEIGFGEFMLKGAGIPVEHPVVKSHEERMDMIGRIQADKAKQPVPTNIEIAVGEGFI